MSNLSAAELLKPGREYRARVIIRKMEDGEPFELSNGSNVKFLLNKKIIKTLKSFFDASELNKIRFLDSNGNEYKLSDIKKNSDFGGKGEGSSTQKEDMALKHFNDLLNKTKKEIGSSTVPIKIKNKTYYVSSAESTPGTPKSDFHLLDINGKEVVWISHKDGTTAKHFQQWGGISLAKEPTIFNHRETQKFISDLKKKYPGGLPPKTTLYRRITDSKLKNMAVYGNNFGGSLGKQNVTILLQGSNIRILSSNKNNYYITADQYHENGDSVDDNGYEPVFMAIYKGDRSDAGIKGTRIVISPIGGRNGDPF